MTSLNVYRHFNLSIQEIFLQGDRVALPSTAVVQEVKKEKVEGGSFFKPFAFAALFFACLAGTAVYIFKPFEKPVVAPVAPPPALPEEEPELYVRIQVIEFADEQSVVESVLVENVGAEPIVSSRTPEPPKPAEAAPVKPTAVVKPQPKRLLPPVPNSAPLPTQGPFYALALLGASAEDAAGISESAKDYARVTVTRGAPSKVWRVYVPVANSEMSNSGIQVTPAGDYPTLEEAEKAAKVLVGGGTSYIRQEERESAIFNVNVCCTDLETAKFIAASSGVTDKVIKVIRQ